MLGEDSLLNMEPDLYLLTHKSRFLPFFLYVQALLIIGILRVWLFGWALKAL